MQSFSFLGPFGFLVPALLCTASLALDLGKLSAPSASWRHQVLCGTTVTLALYVAGLQLCLYGNWMHPQVLLLSLTLLAVCAKLLRHRLHGPLRFTFWSKQTPKLSVVSILVSCYTVGLASLCAYLLPIWQWDSLGYHLPFVNFVLQGGGIRELPVDVPYLSTYPRNVELLFVALRATLPDDRLVDLGQIPLGIIGALATFGIARQLGATRTPATVAASTFLTRPAVFLQLPTNYIDVGVAAFYLLAVYFLLADAKPLNLVLAGVAIGLFLGTKPNAPPNALLLATVLFVRAYRSQHTVYGLIAIALAGALGLEAYVVQLVKHGNPVWPAIVHLGPIELPGTISVNELLSSGAGAEKVHGPLLSRIAQSWTSLSARPTFDMRVGGIGPVLLLFPVALIWIVRRSRFYFILLLLIALVTPDPAVVRYILPFPALLLAAAASAATELKRERSWANHTGVKWGGMTVALALMVWNLNYAAPGLTGEGPPLFSYFKMSWAKRQVAVGANGRPTPFVAATSRLKHGEIAAYDKSLWLPYLMWTSELSNRVIRIPDNAELEQATQLLSPAEVRLLFVGNDQVMKRVISKKPKDYELLFKCPESCTAYFRP